MEIQREIFGMTMEEDLERGGNISFIPFQKRRDAEIFGMAMEEDLEEEMRKPLTLPGDSRISPSSCLEMPDVGMTIDERENRLIDAEMPRLYSNFSN